MTDVVAHKDRQVHQAGLVSVPIRLFTELIFNKFQPVVRDLQCLCTQVPAVLEIRALPGIVEQLCKATKQSSHTSLITSVSCDNILRIRFSYSVTCNRAGQIEWTRLPSQYM